jgi:hypothetical protein
MFCGIITFNLIFTKGLSGFKNITDIPHQMMTKQTVCYGAKSEQVLALAPGVFSGLATK